MTAAVMPAAMTGSVRRVAEIASRWELQIRAVTAAGEEVRRRFPFADLDEAWHEQCRLVHLNPSAFRSGRNRAVIKDTWEKR